MSRVPGPRVFAAVCMALFLLALALTACQKKPADHPSASGQVEPERISVEEIKQRMAAGEAFVFIDARAPAAWKEATAKIPGSVRIPPGQLEKHLGDIPRDKAIVIYCT